MARVDERAEQLNVCSDCGTELGTDVSRAYDGGMGVLVCWDCSLKRGGVFDEGQDRWTVAPEIGSLPDERRPHP